MGREAVEQRTRCFTHRCCGQTALEHLGLMVAAALLVVGLVGAAPGTAARTTQGMSRAVCTVLATVTGRDCPEDRDTAAARTTPTVVRAQPRIEGLQARTLSSEEDGSPFDPGNSGRCKTIGSGQAICLSRDRGWAAFCADDDPTGQCRPGAIPVAALECGATPNQPASSNAVLCGFNPDVGPPAILRCHRIESAPGSGGPASTSCDNTDSDPIVDTLRNPTAMPPGDCGGRDAEVHEDDRTAVATLCVVPSGEVAVCTVSQRQEGTWVSTPTYDCSTRSIPAGLTGLVDPADCEEVSSHVSRCDAFVGTLDCLTFGAGAQQSFHHCALAPDTAPVASPDAVCPVSAQGPRRGLKAGKDPLTLVCDEPDPAPAAANHGIGLPVGWGFGVNGGDGRRVVAGGYVPDDPLAGAVNHVNDVLQVMRCEYDITGLDGKGRSAKVMLGTPELIRAQAKGASSGARFDNSTVLLAGADDVGDVAINLGGLLTGPSGLGVFGNGAGPAEPGLQAGFATINQIVVNESMPPVSAISRPERQALNVKASGVSPDSQRAVSIYDALSGLVAAQTAQAPAGCGGDAAAAHRWWAKSLKVMAFPSYPPTPASFVSWCNAAEVTAPEFGVTDEQVWEIFEAAGVPCDPEMEDDEREAAVCEWGPNPVACFATGRGSGVDVLPSLLALDPGRPGGLGARGTGWPKRQPRIRPVRLPRYTIASLELQPNVLPAPRGTLPRGRLPRG